MPLHSGGNIQNTHVAKALHVAKLVDAGIIDLVLRIFATICAAARPRGVIAGMGDGKGLTLQHAQPFLTKATRCAK
jgi:hypothetical protein|eukprot:COSAG06_NODE_16143_length_1019_cov_1.398913_1_plen_76_part_00